MLPAEPIKHPTLGEYYKMSITLEENFAGRKCSSCNHVVVVFYYWINDNGEISRTPLVNSLPVYCPLCGRKLEGGSTNHV